MWPVHLPSLLSVQTEITAFPVPSPGSLLPLLQLQFPSLPAVSVFESDAVIALAAILPFLPAPFGRSPFGVQQVDSFLPLGKSSWAAISIFWRWCGGHFPFHSPPPLSVSFIFEVLIQLRI